MPHLTSAFSFIDKPFTEQETFWMPFADTPLDTSDNVHLAKDKLDGFGRYHSKRGSYQDGPWVLILRHHFGQMSGYVSYFWVRNERYICSLSFNWYLIIKIWLSGLVPSFAQSWVEAFSEKCTKFPITEHIYPNNFFKHVKLRLTMTSRRKMVSSKTVLNWIF